MARSEAVVYISILTLIAGILCFLTGDPVGGTFWLVVTASVVAVAALYLPLVLVGGLVAYVWLILQALPTIAVLAIMTVLWGLGLVERSTVDEAIKIVLWPTISLIDYYNL